MYNIAEPDALSEIEQRKDKLFNEWEKFHQLIPEKIKSMQAAYLEPALNNYSYWVDMTYILPEDIKDKDGNVIYPKGYTFNPIKYTNVKPPSLVIFNPSDKKEMKLVKLLIKDMNNYMLVGASSSIESMVNFLQENNFNQPVYVLNEELKKKLNLKYTVSIVDVDLGEDNILIKVYSAYKIIGTLEN
jgi:conjugal transfer pilus assembly protein TraW